MQIVIPEFLKPYMQLMRLHQPTGIYLLLLPGWWAIAMAAHGHLPLLLLLLFAIGAVVMRGAGCIVNDIVDRDFDRHVERTRNRPLASGAVSLAGAVLLLLVLLLIALGIALAMNPHVIMVAAVSLVFVAAYPFMKRVTWWPQAFLGITFNIGALMGWVAVTGVVEWPAIWLYVGGIFWTLGYDTIYAHQDTADDIKIGVKSTALRLGENSKHWISGFYGIAVLCWLIAGVVAHCDYHYYTGLFLVALHCAWQVYSVRLDNPSSCMWVFHSNATLGFILFLFVCL